MTSQSQPFMVFVSRNIIKEILVDIPFGGWRSALENVLTASLVPDSISVLPREKGQKE